MIGDGFRAAIAEERLDRLRIVRGEHQRPAALEARGQELAQAVEQGVRARRVLGGGGLVQQQGAVGIVPRA